jgi:hypothetical protein
VRDRQVYVNDKPLHEQYARSSTNLKQESFGPIVVPKKGDMVEVRSDKQLYLNGTAVPRPLDFIRNKRSRGCMARGHTAASF